MFLAAFTFNVIPFSFIPYQVLILIYASRAESAGALAALVLANALGATAAKIVIYLTARGLGAALRGSRVQRRWSSLVSRFSSGALLAVLLAALLPIPDDAVYIPVAFAKFPLLRYALAVLTGKTLNSALLVFMGSGAVAALQQLGLEGWALTVALTVATAVAVYIVGTLDPAKLFGALAALRKMLPPPPRLKRSSGGSRGEEGRE